MGRCCRRHVFGRLWSCFCVSSEGPSGATERQQQTGRESGHSNSRGKSAPEVFPFPNMRRLHGGPFHSPLARTTSLPPTLALTRLPVDVLVTGSTPTALAAMQATRTIPIVTIGTADPVGSGLVRSYDRPGGNVTGTTVGFEEASSKWLELLKALRGSIRRVAVIQNSTNLGVRIMFEPLRPRRSWTGSRRAQAENTASLAPVTGHPDAGCARNRPSPGAR